MNGLLDFLNDDSTGRSEARLALASGLLNGRGSSISRLATGMQGYNQALAQAKREEDLRKAREQELQMREMQMQEARRAQAERAALMERQRGIEGAYRGAIVSPQEQAMSQFGGPTKVAAGAMPGMMPQIDQRRLINSLAQIDPQTAFQMLTPKQDDYKVVGDALVAVGPSGVKEAYKAAPKPEKPPTSVQEFLYAQQNPAFSQWDESRRRAGATNIGLPKIDIKVGEGLAKEIGPMIAGSYSTAAAATPAIENSNRIMSALDSGNVIAGPFADARVKAAQLADVLGVGGKTTEEKLANTRQVIQGLAQSTLNARAALQGQGAVSNFEQATLEKAVSGNISDMTASEIRQIAALNKRLNEQLIQRHRSLMQRAKKQPGLEGIADMFDVPDQPAAPVMRQPGGGTSIDDLLKKYGG